MAARGGALGCWEVGTVTGEAVAPLEKLIPAFPGAPWASPDPKLEEKPSQSGNFSEFLQSGRFGNSHGNVLSSLGCWKVSKPME